MQKILFVLFLFLLGCANRETGPTDMYFELNNKLVDKKITDSTLKINYQVPSVWKDITSDTGVREKLKGVNLENLEVRKILSSADGLSLFALLDISKVSTENFRRLKANYKTELNTDGKWLSVTMDSFRKDGFDVSQYVMANKNATQFELLFFNDSKPALALNFFTLPDSSYGAKTKILESIIASIKPL